MSARLLVRTLTAVLGLLLPLLAVAPTGSAASVEPQARTVIYDASGAGEFVSTFHSAASVWNSSVTNVRLVAGSPANVRILVDNGWPRASVSGLGRGTIIMGRQAVNQGYFPLRIATHEFGHILGLPDRRTGLCSDLMSGSSAPVSCRNANPSAAERAQVDRNFAGSVASVGTYVWSPEPARLRSA
jgi:snapalysin